MDDERAQLMSQAGAEFKDRITELESDIHMFKELLTQKDKGLQNSSG